MPEPIEARLRTSEQVALARLQDCMVESLLEVDSGIILHGGTAIWRCYNGNRFSNDVDVYATDAQVKKLWHNFTWSLSKRGAAMDYPKIGRAIKVHNGEASTKLEAMEPYKGMHPTQMEYRKADGSTLFVTTPSLQDFINEKIYTYQKRKYVRDLYDIYHLTSAGGLQPGTKRNLRAFVKEIKRPIDEDKLRDLIYVGATPSFDTMVGLIRGRIR